ncbi:MAG: inositol monophosphatase family protein [Candidatus Loosdrechtia sp.]|uniref:inositol monophosphatase family protein n=1 Tax=Candidatus Loosdrechtia sp. TaxID=3101272 RepID=UPI003A690B27|nr:MAG: inositol monophosphatase family protein [Candidatus Jettenia sp. AMX2]
MSAKTNELVKYLGVAREAALFAGVILKERFGKLCPSMIDEKAKNDFVTDVDRKSEKIIKDVIRSHFHDHDILAEESLPENRSSPFLWIIDPLDGTSNYIHSLPHFAISIGLEIEGELAVGLIYEPLRETIYSAIKGGGSFKNGRHITISHPKTLNTSLIATGFPFRIKSVIDAYLRSFREIFMHASGIRRCGSACLDLAFTAEGIFGGFYECALSPWDMAAGALLVKEAGGIVTDFTGGNQYLEAGTIIAANKGVHREMLKIIQETLWQAHTL